MTLVTRKVGTPKPATTGPKTRLEAARWEAGYPGADGLKRFARRVRRCPLYVRRIELHGRAPMNYAWEAQRHLRCHMNLFMWPDWTPPAETPVITDPRKADHADHRNDTDRTSDTDGRGGAPRSTLNARRLLAQEAAQLARR